MMTCSSCSLMMTTKRFAFCLIAVVVATTSASASSAPASCTDGESYRSSLGLSCFQHRHLNCGGLFHLGLINQQELEDLLVSCPVSCNAPQCSDGHKRIIDAERQEGKRTITHKDTRNEISETLTGNRAVHRREQSSCYPNWPPSCQDDPFYTNKIGLGCPQMIVFSCADMHKIGFSERETYDLINSCPCSCGHMCGTWTGPPTAKLIPAPSISTSTFSPTSVPTAGPSPRTKKPAAFVSPTTTTTTTTTTPTATESFLPSSTPSQPSSTIAPTKTSSTTTTFVPHGFIQQPKSDGAEKTWSTGGISDTLTISLFFVAGAVMSLLAVAAYFSYTKKRKMAPAGEDGTISKVKPCSGGDERGSANAKSKISEQISPVWEADRFVVICDDEYDSKNNEEGLEIADSSLPRPTSPARSALAQMLQGGSTHSNENTVQEASLGDSTIFTNDQASLRFEDDYIGQVESYSKAGEDDALSEKTPKISNNHRLASFWRTKRLAQLARAKDGANKATKSTEDRHDIHDDDTIQVKEEEESVTTKVISHRTKDRTDSTAWGVRSDASTVIMSAENGCNALNGCLPTSPGPKTKSDELLDVDGIEAELKQAKDDLKVEMKQLRKDLGLNMLESKASEEVPSLDEQSTYTDSLWTRDTKETTTTTGSFRGNLDQELTEAKEFLARGANDFVGFLACSAQGRVQDFIENGDGKTLEKDDDGGDGGSHIEGFTAYTFSPLQARRTEHKLEASSSRNDIEDEASENVEVPLTNKPMALHTQTRTGHGARVVRGIQGTLSPHEVPQQHVRAHYNADDTDDRSDAYTCTPMTRDTICVEGHQEKATTRVTNQMHVDLNRWQIPNTEESSHESWDETTYADDTAMYEIRQGRRSDESRSTSNAKASGC